MTADFYPWERLPSGQQSRWNGLADHSTALRDPHGQLTAIKRHVEDYINYGIGGTPDFVLGRVAQIAGVGVQRPPGLETAVAFPRGPNG
jgi:hypothetical protein